MRKERAPSSKGSRISGEILAVAGERDRTSASDELPEGTELPAAWVSRLLTLVLELPRSDEAAVVGGVVDALASLVPECAVGACVTSRGGGAITEVRVLFDGPNAGRGADPTRLFPGFPHERVLALADLPGSTLHLGSMDPTHTREGSLHDRLLAAAARVLLRGLADLEREENMRALASQVVQAEKLASFGQVAAELVHELNNPLTSIVAYTDFLMRRLSAREGVFPEEVERLRRIGESAQRVLRFTRDLVGYTRQATPAKAAVPVQSVVDQALLFCEHLFSGSGVTIERAFGEGVPPVTGSAEQLTQVFVNLLTNAAHATRESAGAGHVRVTSELAEADKVRVAVTDDGGGIAPANLARVFDPFFTTKMKGDGTGLGLAIVKTIVEAHGGKVWAENEVGKGARFVVVLPAAR